MRRRLDQAGVLCRAVFHVPETPGPPFSLDGKRRLAAFLRVSSDWRGLLKESLLAR